MKDKKVKQILSGVGISGKRGEGKGKESKCGGSILYSCIKIEQ
jgi:hypothetical protein